MWEPRRLTTLWAYAACYRDSFTLPFYHIVFMCHAHPKYLNSVTFCKKPLEILAIYIPNYKKCFREREWGLYNVILTFRHSDNNQFPWRPLQYTFLCLCLSTFSDWFLHFPSSNNMLYSNSWQLYHLSPSILFLSLYFILPFYLFFYLKVTQHTSMVDRRQ
jgi:hypothetical protein